MKRKILVLTAIVIAFSITYNFIQFYQPGKPLNIEHRGIKIAHASVTDGGALACGDCHVDPPSTSCMGCHNPPQIISGGEIKLWHHKQSSGCSNCHGSFDNINVPDPKHGYCNNCHSGFSHNG